ncbi:MAG: O-antigen ligase family protein [Gemmatimonadaceae bacterium]
MEAETASPPVINAGRSGGARMSASTVAFAIFIAVTLAGLGGLGGRLFAVAFVAAAAVAGLVAYYRAPTRYVAFVFALWFFTPFVRRVVDLHHGFQPASFILVAPVLVTLIAGLTAVYRARELRGTLMYPFAFMLTGVLYGFFIGVLKNGMFAAAWALLAWLGPISFSMHLILNWRTLPAIRKAFLDFLQWTVPVLGAYGIFQVIALPAWDRYWMVAANLASLGLPVPFGFRAFGTMNSPGPYAVVLMIGMLFLLGTARRGMVISLTLALIALLLTRTRSGWVALGIGLFIILFMGPTRRATRNWFFILLMGMVAVPVLSLDVFRDSIARRLLSFTALEDDNSVRQRVMLSNLAIQEIGRRAEGEGLGSTGGAVKISSDIERQASIDNGFLEIFYVLGWPGGAMVMMGLLGQLLTLARFRDSRHDAFANAARAVFWSFLSVLLIGDIFSGASGAMFWAAYGFACSAHAYNYAKGTGLRSRQLARDFAAYAPTSAGG